MTVFIEKERCDHVRIANDTGVAMIQYEFGVVGPFAAVADEDIAIAAVGSFHVEEGIQIQVAAVDLKALELTFGTVGAPVYWDAATNKFSDTSTIGYYRVGFVILAKDANGVVVFEKTRYAVVV